MLACTGFRQMAHILCISNDQVLVRTRELLLRSEGYEVKSTLGFVQAAEQCRTASFDLCLIGHSVVPSDKLALITAFRATNSAPIIVMIRGHEPPPPNVVIHDTNHGPKMLLERIRKALAS
jgi:DNA-binding NtrC family response regulator